LFKKEIRDKMDWPAYPMLREICNWEVELRDEGAHVVLVSKDGTLDHMEPRGHDTWEHIDQMVTFLGNVIVGADQRTYNAVAARAANRWLTRSNTRAMFRGTTPREWYNESFTWLVKGMPRAHRDINVWRDKVDRYSKLPPIRDPDLWINRQPIEVPKVQRPGYCYLILFQERFHKAFDWPAYPTWSEITLFDKNLREEGWFEITATGRIWHVEQSDEPMGTWLTVQHLGYSKHAGD
jgi:hypothetical protein